MSETRIDDVVELVEELLAEFPDGLKGSAVQSAICTGTSVDASAVAYALGIASMLGLVEVVGGYNPRIDLREQFFKRAESLLSPLEPDANGSDHAEK